MNKTIPFLAAALLNVAGVTCLQAQDKLLTTFKENIWVCVSPQVYDEAMMRVNEQNGKDLEPLRKDLAEKKQCMFVDEEMVESIMAPFALVINREGPKVQVQFIVSFRKRVELLHRLINRYVLVGWTDESNLVPKKIM